MSLMSLPIRLCIPMNNPPVHVYLIFEIRQRKISQNDFPYLSSVRWTFAASGWQGHTSIYILEERNFKRTWNVFQNRSDLWSIDSATEYHNVFIHVHWTNRKGFQHYPVSSRTFIGNFSIDAFDWLIIYPSSCAFSKKEKRKSFLDIPGLKRECNTKLRISLRTLQILYWWLSLYARVAFLKPLAQAGIRGYAKKWKTNAPCIIKISLN